MWEISTWWTAAAIAWWAGLAAALQYFNVSGEVVLILSILLFVDFILWITDAYMKDRYSVTSTQMWRGLVKKMTRWCLPLIVVWILRWAGMGELEIASTTIFSILIITEGYSIIGHIFSINSDWEKTLPEIDAIKMLTEVIFGLFKWKMPAEKKEEDKVEE